MQGKLLIFSAPSGAGKTTIVRHLLTKPEFKLEFSISACSREPRKNEIHGKDYYFLSVEEFKQRINENAFLEWEEVYDGLFYGTLFSEVQRIRNTGNNVLFDVDVKGGINIKKYYKENALSVFVQPPNIQILENRLRSRSTDSEEEIKKRLNKAAYELEFASLFDFILINDNLETTLKNAEILVKDFLIK
jgi:guanylate kinase